MRATPTKEAVMVESKIDEMIRCRQAPGLHRLNDGPGSSSTQKVFDRPDVVKEVQMDLRAMEDAGRLRDPKAMQNAQIKMRAVKNREAAGLVKKLDYQKGDHPLDKR